MLTGYLRVIAARWWVVGLIAAASAILASLVYLVVRPQAYVATAMVIVPSPQDAGSVIPSTAQAVADLQAVIETRAFAERVAERLDLEVDDVAGALDSRRVGTGGVVEVVADARDASTAQGIALAAGREALAALAQARLAPFTARLEVAEQRYLDASDSVRTFLERFGHILPQNEFGRVANRLSDLRLRADQARDEGDAARVAEIEARIEALTEEWSPLIVEWQTLSAARGRAQRQLEAAEADYATAYASLEAAVTGDGVVGSRAVVVPRTRVFLRSVLPIVVVATALAILLVVGLEMAGPWLAQGAVENPAPPRRGLAERR